MLHVFDLTCFVLGIHAAAAPPSLLFRVDSFVESPISDPSPDSLILIIKVPHWALTIILLSLPLREIYFDANYRF